MRLLTIALGLLLISAAPPAGEIRKFSFTQGVDGYKGTFDIEIWELSPNRVMEGADTVTSDANNNGGESQILVRFDDIIGTGPKQIPPKATVRRAHLVVIAFDPGNVVNIHRMLVPWGKSVTWNSMVAGVSADGTEASRHKDGFTFGKIVANKQSIVFDVTDTVQQWVNGAPNYGWVFLNTGANGWDFYSSEHSEISNHPQLYVEVVEPNSR